MQGGVLGRVSLRRSFPLRFLFSNLLSAALVGAPSLLFRELFISTGVSGCPVRIIASDVSALSCLMGAVEPVRGITCWTGIGGLPTFGFGHPNMLAYTRPPARGFRRGIWGVGWGMALLVVPKMFIY